MSNTLSYEYVSQKPGVTLIKAGTTPLKELNGLLGLPALISQIKDIPITSDNNALSAGRFVMRPSLDFEFEYTYLEVKVVLSGQIIIRDEHDVKYVAEAGDLLVFTPTTKVIFDGDSHGEAVYFAHRLPADSFL